MSRSRRLFTTSRAHRRFVVLMTSFRAAFSWRSRFVSWIAHSALDARQPQKSDPDPGSIHWPDETRPTRSQTLLIKVASFPPYKQSAASHDPRRADTPSSFSLRTHILRFRRRFFTATFLIASFRWEATPGFELTVLRQRQAQGGREITKYTYFLSKKCKAFRFFWIIKSFRTLFLFDTELVSSFQKVSVGRSIIIRTSNEQSIDIIQFKIIGAKPLNNSDSWKNERYKLEYS